MGAALSVGVVSRPRRPAPPRENGRRRRCDRRARGARQPQQTETQPGDPKPVDLLLQIEATTTVVPGGSRLVEIANFMTALAEGPVLAPRFQLKTWDVRPAGAQGGEEQLHISIGLAEKRS